MRDGETDGTALRILRRADVPLNQRGVNVWSIPAGKMRRRTAEAPHEGRGWPRQARA